MMDLPAYTSGKPCPRCSELLHWSQNERPPEVSYNTFTGYVFSVTLMRFCISCGYRETGIASVERQPIWRKENEQ